MQKIIDGLLFDTEKAELICSFNYKYYHFGEGYSEKICEAVRRLTIAKEIPECYLQLCFIFRTKKDAYFTIGVFDQYEKTVSFMASLQLSKTLNFETLIGGLIERFPHLEIKWCLLTEKHARKICEDILSVSDYMKYFSIEEA